MRDGELAELNRAGHDKERLSEILKSIDGRFLCNYSVPHQLSSSHCVHFLSRLLSYDCFRSC